MTLTALGTRQLCQGCPEVALASQSYVLFIFSAYSLCHCGSTVYVLLFQHWGGIWIRVGVDLGLMCYGKDSHVPEDNIFESSV